MPSRYSTEIANPAKCVKASGSDLRVHFKNTHEVAVQLKGYSLKRAQSYLQHVIEKKETVPFRRFNRGVGRNAQSKNFYLAPQARWPKKSAEFLLNLLENAQANAEVKGLDVERLNITHIMVNAAQRGRRRTYRAHGRINPFMSSPCHIEMVLTEKEDKVNKAQNQEVAKITNKISPRRAAINRREALRTKRVVKEQPKKEKPTKKSKRAAEEQKAQTQA